MGRGLGRLFRFHSKNSVKPLIADRSNCINRSGAANASSHAGDLLDRRSRKMRPPGVTPGLRLDQII